MDYLKKSRIEEVLIAILGKGNVTSRLLSRIEKILDAIRVKGSYDGIVMSEVEEILVCILLGKRFEKPTHSRIAAMLKVKANGGEYTELRKSRIEELIFEWIEGTSEIITYTGTLPATLQTAAGYLAGYKIWGNTGGVGNETENLAPFIDEWGDGYVNIQGFIAPADENMKERYSPRIAVEPGATYQLAYQTGTFPESPTSLPWIGVGWYNDDGFIKRTAGPYKTAVPLVAPANAMYAIVSFRSYGENYNMMLMKTSTAPTSYIPYGYKLPILSNDTTTDIYIGDTQLAKDEYVDSATGKIYRRTENLSPPEEEWIDGQIGGGDGTVHPSTQIKVSPFIDVSTCETCIMEVFSAETEWAAAGYREMAFYDENEQYLGWIGGGGRQTLTPNSSERLSEFPTGTVYVRIGCSHGDQPFYPQLVSGYTPTHQFYPYLVPTDPPAPFPQIPTFAGTTVIDYNGAPKPDKVEFTYSKPK